MPIYPDFRKKMKIDDFFFKKSIRVNQNRPEPSLLGKSGPFLAKDDLL